VCSKAGISQLNLPHGTNKKVENRKTKKKKKSGMLRVIGKQSGESAESVLEKKRGVGYGGTVTVYHCSDALIIR